MASSKKRLVPPFGVNQIEGRVGTCEAPHPAQQAVVAPPGFDGVQHTRLETSLMNLFLPGPEDLREPMPDFGQVSLADLQSQMAVEDFDDLAGGVAES